MSFLSSAEISPLRSELHEKKNLGLVSFKQSINHSTAWSVTSPLLGVHVDDDGEDDDDDSE